MDLNLCLSSCFLFVKLFSLLFFFCPQSTCSISCPTSVILLRFLALLICAFLAAVFFYKLPEEATSPSSGETSTSKPANESLAANKSSEVVPVLQSLVQLLPDVLSENTKLAWQHARDSQIAVASVGLMTCLTGIFLAGPSRYTFTTILFQKISAALKSCASHVVAFPD